MYKRQLKAQATACATYALRLKQQAAESPNESLKGADISVDSRLHQGYISDADLQTRWGQNYDYYRSLIQEAVDQMCIRDSDTLWQNPYLERQCPLFSLRNLRELSQECDWPQVESQLRRGQEVLLRLPSLFSGEETSSVRLLPCLDDGALEAVFALFPACLLYTSCAAAWT